TTGTSSTTSARCSSSGERRRAATDAQRPWEQSVRTVAWVRFELRRLLMRSRLMGLVALAAVLEAGCATFKPQACPAGGGYPWYEVATPHFQILSDLDPPALRAAAVRMEREREALVQVLKWDPDVRSLIVHFRSEPELGLIGLKH